MEKALKKNEDDAKVIKDLKEKVVQAEKKNDVFQIPAPPADFLQFQPRIVIPGGDDDEVDHPRCQDNSLDMRFRVNKGLSKYSFGGVQIIGKEEQKRNQGAGAVVYLGGYHPTCKDGSLDMRCKVNRGLKKYGNYVF